LIQRKIATMQQSRVYSVEEVHVESLLVIPENPAVSWSKETFQGSFNG
jgi:hypothetical protein